MALATDPLQNASLSFGTYSEVEVKGPLSTARQY